LSKAVVDVDSVDLFKSRLENFGYLKMLDMIRPTLSTLPVPEKLEYDIRDHVTAFTPCK